jgi:hypothetical protein
MITTRAVAAGRRCVPRLCLLPSSCCCCCCGCLLLLLRCSGHNLQSKVLMQNWLAEPYRSPSRPQTALAFHIGLGGARAAPRPGLRASRGCYAQAEISVLPPPPPPPLRSPHQHSCLCYRTAAAVTWVLMRPRYSAQRRHQACTIVSVLMFALLPPPPLLK